MSMLRRCRPNGFTLIELAIVVGVAGLLFGGLWRLLSSGNSQLREQAAADQINQIIGATRNFLASQNGQTYMAGFNANQVQQLGLPATAANAAGQAACAANLAAGTGTYCDFLPTGFWSGITNAYGQTYQVWVLKDNQPNGTAPQNYNFLVLTTGGDIIPDSSGGRITANIGANGGFVYSNNVCGNPATNFTCGAFGSYAVNLAGGAYGAISPGSGHIAAQTNSAQIVSTNVNWLARIPIPGDITVPPNFNTMRTSLNMQNGAGASINMYGNTINMNTGGGAGGGTIRPDGGRIGLTGDTGYINLTNPNATDVTATFQNTTTNVGNYALDVIGQDCDNVFSAAGTCQIASHVRGSMLVTRSIAADTGSFTNLVQGGSFVYGSDRSLKKDIQPLTDSLNRLARLQGRSFSWKKDGRKDIGLIAQEVQDVYPELVMARTDGKLGVEYGNLVAPLIEAVKELKTQNERLQERVRALEAAQLGSSSSKP